MNGYELADVDADGVGRPVLAIRALDRNARALVEAATRLLVLAENLDGGMDKALALIRAEVIRQATRV